MASMRASQPELVWGPWRPAPPKTVNISKVESAPVRKMLRPVVRSLRVSGCIGARGQGLRFRVQMTGASS